jgi:hypothetical protein
MLVQQELLEQRQLELVLRLRSKSRRRNLQCCHRNCNRRKQKPQQPRCNRSLVLVLHNRS